MLNNIAKKLTCKDLNKTAKIWHNVSNYCNIQYRREKDADNYI